jgi:hypothetical protein
MLRRALVLVLSLSLLAAPGCVWFSAVPTGFERISLRAQVERDAQGGPEGDLVAYSTLKGVLVGSVVGLPSAAITGGGIGVGIGFLGCAPTLFLYPLCVALAGLAGVVIGAAVGLVGGGVMGGIGGLPSETAKQVTASLSRLEEGRNLDDDLLAAVRAAIPQGKQVDAANAQATVTARLDEFDLGQHARDRLSVRLRAAMVQDWRPPGEEPKQKTCRYRYTSEKTEAETWLAGDGAPFGEAVTRGMQEIARWMNRDLEAFATGRELPKTETDPASCFREKRWYRWFSF